MICGTRILISRSVSFLSSQMNQYTDTLGLGPSKNKGETASQRRYLPSPGIGLPCGSTNGGARCFATVELV